MFLLASIEPVLAAGIGDNRVIPIAMATERAIRERLALSPLRALAVRVPYVSSTKLKAQVRAFILF